MERAAGTEYIMGEQKLVENRRIENDSEDQYTSDFYAEKKDGIIIIRECVWRKNLSRPTTAKLLDISRNYWLTKKVEDWGIVIEKDPYESA